MRRGIVLAALLTGSLASCSGKTPAALSADAGARPGADAGMAPVVVVPGRTAAVGNRLKVTGRVDPVPVLEQQGSRFRIRSQSP